MPGESSTFPLFSLIWALSRPWRGPVPSVLAALPLLPLLPLCVLLAAVHRGLFVYMADLFWKSGQLPSGSLFPRVAYWFVYECESCCSHEENFDFFFSFFLSVTCFGPSLSLKWLRTAPLNKTTCVCWVIYKQFKTLHCDVCLFFCNNLKSSCNNRKIIIIKEKLLIHLDSCRNDCADLSMCSVIHLLYHLPALFVFNPLSFHINAQKETCGVLATAALS